MEDGVMRLQIAESSAPAAIAIRLARPEDAELLVNLVRELAIYEKREHLANATSADFERHLFGPRPLAEAAVAEVDGKPVAFALWFTTFSTFRGHAGIYLEDLFVKPAFRGRGIGKALLATVARLAVERGCGPLKWTVLDWNSPAIGFYRSIGAQPMEELTIYRLEDEALRRLGEKAPHPAEPRVRAGGS